LDWWQKCGNILECRSDFVCSFSCNHGKDGKAGAYYITDFLERDAILKLNAVMGSLGACLGVETIFLMPMTWFRAYLLGLVSQDQDSFGTAPAFCHAMLCKRGLCHHACGVCLSVCVCLSVTFVHSVRTNKHIFRIFSSSGSHTILVFSAPNGMAIFRREPPNGEGSRM